MDKQIDKKYIEEMKCDCFCRDIELNHSNADYILCDLLKELGYIL